MRLINFPHLLGQKKIGVNKNGKYLKQVLNNNLIDIKCNNSVRNKYQNMINNLWNLYRENIFHKDKINIGGDHSMSIATVADSLNRTPPEELKVLWFDAHPDINTYRSSPTKNFHGMPLSFLTGLDENDDFSFIVNKLPIKNIMYIGIRDINRYEQKIINRYDMWNLTSQQVNNEPEYCHAVIKSFIGNNPFHLSFDVDCLDPYIIPCTGTPVENGLELKQTKYIIDKLLEYPNLINMDITELNLELGTEEQQLSSLNNFLYLFDKYLKKKDKE